MNKGTYILNYLIKNPLRPKNLNKLAKHVKKINGGWDLKKEHQNGKFKDLPSAPGHYGNAFRDWRSSGLIKTINGLVEVTKKGKFYKNNPYSNKIPPRDYTATAWKHVLKLRRIQQQIQEDEKKKIKFLEGRTIKEVRYLTEYEVHKFGWTKRSVVLILDNGDYITPSIDEEGNEAGVLFTEGRTLGRL